MVLLLAGGYFFYVLVTKTEVVVTSFEECEEAGYPVFESYPEQCRDSNGILYVRDIGDELDKFDLVRIGTPRPNEMVTSPLTITGEARGMWFFEATFPVEIRDANGVVLGSHYVSALGEWMTEEFVSFEAVLEFESSSTPIGVLVLQKNNASGLPKYDDEFEVPVRFFSADSE